MPQRKGLLAPQNTFLDTIATRFDGTHSNFVLGNAKIACQPIVYCSDGFCDLTGYLRLQIMQKSCACDFLYGPKTSQQHQEAISRALSAKEELKLEVILYKSSKTPFWCLLDIVPIQDEKHEVVMFLCSHKDITKQKLRDEKLHQQLVGGEHQQHQQPTAAAAEQAPGEQAAAEPGDRRKSSMEQEFQVGSSSCSNSWDEQERSDGESADHDKHTANLYSRRRSRAVLYQLSGHYGGNRRNVNMKSKLKLNNRMNIPEYKTTTIEKQRFLLSHYGFGKSCWDWLILAVSFYVAIVVPYNATFKDKLLDPSGDCKIDSIDILVEIVFVVDVILNFRTTFVNRKGEVVTVPKTICLHYVRGWFVVDACAALPFDLLCSLNLYNRSRLDLNLLKLIRLLRLARLLQKMDRYSQYSYIILTMLMLIFALLAHWCACIWYVIARWEIDNNPSNWRLGWLHQLSDKLGYSVVNTTDMSSAYTTALYFTTSSLTSVGFGNVSANTNAEKVFSIVIMLMGALMHAVIFGNVTALIRVMYARRSNYQTRLRELKDFFRLHQLPKELQQRMIDYFQTTWSLNHGIETGEILKDFPEELRGDVLLHLHREVLSLPIFETAPQGFLKSLARHIESKFCCPTEFLIHRKDVLNYLYLVCNGSMEVLQENMVVAILGKGDLVGYDVSALATPEHTLFGLNKSGGPMGGLVKSRCDLKALTYCDLKCINVTGLLEVLKTHTEFSDIFHREIIHDLSFNLREGGDEPDASLAGESRQQSPKQLLAGNAYFDPAPGAAGANDEPNDASRSGAGATSGRNFPANMGQLYTSAGDRAEQAAAMRPYHSDEDDDDEDDEDDEDDDDEEEEEDDDDDDDDDDEEDDEEDEDNDDVANADCSSSASSAKASGDELDEEDECRKESGGPVEGAGAGKLAAVRQRLGGARKPTQLSFDLSRNTTALVDRRRRSAGCIQRPAQLSGACAQAEPAGARPKASALAGANHGSLTHIHEGRRPAAAARVGSPRQRGRLRRVDTGPPTWAHRPEELEAEPGKSSLRSIEARMAIVSAGVREMRQELGQELHHFRASLQLLLSSVQQPVSPRPQSPGAPGQQRPEAGSRLTLDASSHTSPRSPASLGQEGARAGRGPPAPGSGSALARSFSAASLFVKDACERAAGGGGGGARDHAEPSGRRALIGYSVRRHRPSPGCAPANDSDAR